MFLHILFSFHILSGWVVLCRQVSRLHCKIILFRTFCETPFLFIVCQCTSVSCKNLIAFAFNDVMFASASSLTLSHSLISFSYLIWCNPCTTCVSIAFVIVGSQVRDTDLNVRRLPVLFGVIGYLRYYPDPLLWGFRLNFQRLVRGFILPLLYKNNNYTRLYTPYRLCPHLVGLRKTLLNLYEKTAFAVFRSAL